MSELSRDAIEMLYEDEGAYWAGVEVLTRGPLGEGSFSRLLSLDAWQREVEVGRSRGGPAGAGLPNLVDQNEAGVGVTSLARVHLLEAWQRDVEVGGSRPRGAGVPLRLDRQVASRA